MQHKNSSQCNTKNGIIVILLALPVKFVRGRLLQAVSMCPSAVQSVKLTLRNARNTRLVHIVLACLELSQRSKFVASLMFNHD